MSEQNEQERVKPSVNGDSVPDANPVDESQSDEVVVDAAPVAEDITDSRADEGPADEDTGDQETAESEAETPAVTIARLETELAAAQTDAAANLDQMKRVAAEFQNSKRRQEKQLADAIDRAGAQVAGGLLPILDDLDLAFQNMPETLGEEEEAWIDGFRQIQRKLADLLATQGVEPIALTGEFDPNLHEAISSEPNEDVESGHIIETLRAGYTHKGRVLRPALVRVAM